MNMSNFLIFGVFQMLFTEIVLNVIKAGFHRSGLIYIGIKSSTVQKKTSSTKRFLLSHFSEFIQVKNQSFNICTYKVHESRENKKNQKKIMDIVSK